MTVHSCVSPTVAMDYGWASAKVTPLIPRLSGDASVIGELDVDLRGAGERERDDRPTEAAAAEGVSTGEPSNCTMNRS